MYKKLVRSVLVAAVSVLMAVAASSGFSRANDDVRANTGWPTATVSVDAQTNGAGS